VLTSVKLLIFSRSNRTAGSGTFRILLLLPGLRRFVSRAGGCRLPDRAMAQDVNSTFSPDESVLNFCSTAMRGCSAAHVSPAYSTLPRQPVYESSFWTSRQVCETSRHRTAVVSSRLELATRLFVTGARTCPSWRRGTVSLNLSSYSYIETPQSTLSYRTGWNAVH